MSGENKPTFIKIGDTRIRLSNIKFYAIYESYNFDYGKHRMLTIHTYQDDRYEFTDTPDNDDIDIDEAVRKLDLYLT